MALRSFRRPPSPYSRVPPPTPKIPRPRSRTPNNMSRRGTSRPPKSSCATRSAKRRKTRFFMPGWPTCIYNSATLQRRSAKRGPPCERKGDEADYIPVLADALLRQEKFADLLDLVKPGDRAPALESKVRTALGTAEAGLRDRDKAEDLLREAVKLDPSRRPPQNSACTPVDGNETRGGGQVYRRSDRRQSTLGRSPSSEGRDAAQPR